MEQFEKNVIIYFYDAENKKKQDENGGGRGGFFYEITRQWLSDHGFLEFGIGILKI